MVCNYCGKQIIGRPYLIDGEVYCEDCKDYLDERGDNDIEVLEEGYEEDIDI